MKRLSLLFIIVLIASGCATEEEKTYTTSLGMFTPYHFYPETLQGKVKSIIEKNYYAKEEAGEIVKDIPITIAARDTFSWTNDFKVMFNELGLLMKIEALDENDNIISVEETIIEDDKVVIWNSFERDTLIMQTFVKYNEKGFYKEFKMMQMPEDTLIYKAEFKTDSTGTIKGFRMINWDGEKGYTFKYKFNESSVYTGYTINNPAGEQTLECSILKNEKGFMTQQIYSRKRGDEVTDITYEDYDEMGNWTKYSAITDDMTWVISERIYTYYDE